MFYKTELDRYTVAKPTKMQTLSYRILTNQNEVAQLLPFVVEAADSDRDSLGFFPHQVFADYARKEQLFVAIASTAEGEKYVGHLLFSLSFPKGSVLQIFVSKESRRHNIASRLLGLLKTQLTELQFISIYARVAEELVDSNRFWEQQGFYAQRLAPGGLTRKRTIVVRSHELKTPQLFQSSGISAADPLGLDQDRDSNRPLFLLDLNVLFDLGPRRKRNDQTIALFRAERMDVCSLAISSEIVTELKRTSQTVKTDPMQDLASTLPSFPVPPEDEWNRLAVELVRIVFSLPSGQDDLTTNDVSDLRHLATAIHHQLPGFVTSDQRILDSAYKLRQQYGVEVISPNSFQAQDYQYGCVESHSSSSNVILICEPAREEDDEDIRELLRRLEIDVGSLSTKWAAYDGQKSGSFRMVVKVLDTIVGYLVWPKAIASGPITACLAVAENSGRAEDTVRLMLSHLLEQVEAGSIQLIRILCPAKQVVVREVAAAFGYTRSLLRPNELQKVAVKSFVSERNWSSVRKQLIEDCGVILPEISPVFKHVHQHTPVFRPDGEQVLVPLFKLETLLAPALFCLRGRSGVLVPVQKRYSEHLLQRTAQASLLPRAHVQLVQERHYLSGPSTIRSFSPGDLMLFYESGKAHGAAAVIAVARVIRSYQRHEAVLGDVDLTASVIVKSQLANIGKAKVKTVTVFDNLLALPTHVDLSQLRKIGCGEANQLITSRKITSEQVQCILEIGLQ
jgi:GNAT superfamily N-acetyltransferase